MTQKNSSSQVIGVGYSEGAPFHFRASAGSFCFGLGLVTFEQVRPAGIMLSDYFFFLSFLFLLPSIRSRLQQVKGSGILLAGTLIWSGSILSLMNDSDFTGVGGTFARLFVLYWVFAPLALVHCNDVRKNLWCLLGGISANCVLTMIQAWIFPGIVRMLSISPLTPDQSDINRFQGLTMYPVTLGQAAGFGVLIAFGLLLFEKRTHMRWLLAAQIFACIQGALLSGSRTFLVALLPAMLAFGLMLKQHRRTVLKASVVVVLLSVILTVFVPGAFSQYSARLSAVGMLDIGRIVIAINAVVEIAQKPFYGWGVNHFSEAGATIFPGSLGYGSDALGAHVTLLQYWYGGGLLAAIGFVTLFVIPAKRMLHVIKSPRNNCTNAVCLFLACYLCFFIIVNLGPYLYNRYLYIPMFIFAGFTTRVLNAIRTAVSVENA